MSEFARSTATVEVRSWRRSKIGAVVLGAVAALSACAPGTTGASRPDSNPSSQLGSAPSPSPSRPLVVEYADNHLGVPVYADNRGSAVTHGEPARIPYGTEVQVDCYEPNESGMSSINMFYVLAGGVWSGDRAAANSFDNGAGMGPNGVNLDPRIQPC